MLQYFRLVYDIIFHQVSPAYFDGKWIPVVDIRSLAFYRIPWFKGYCYDVFEDLFYHCFHELLVPMQPHWFTSHYPCLLYLHFRFLSISNFSNILMTYNYTILILSLNSGLNTVCLGDDYFIIVLDSIIIKISSYKKMTEPG